MNTIWTKIARRAVQGLVLQPGQQVLVRDHSGRYDVLLEMVFAIEQDGLSPIVDLITPNYLRRLISSTTVETLQHWDRHRQDWLQRVDGILELAGADFDRDGLPEAAFTSWREASNRLREIEESRGLPYMLLVVPNEERARSAGMSLAELEDLVLPALAASADELKREIIPVLRAVQAGQTLTLHSGEDFKLQLVLGDRRWLVDDGVIDSEDRSRGAVVSNLPAGSIYTTVLEPETQGSLFLPEAFQGKDIVLHFKEGRIHSVESEAKAEFIRMLDRHSGEPRRISHIGIALNPYLHQPCNWIVVDEHIHGRVFIALGENRYMGGENASSLNIDYSLPNATLVCNKGLSNERVIVEAGRIVTP